MLSVFLADNNAGPKASEYLQKHTASNLTPLTFGRAAYIYIDGIKVHVARGGYTGEDGFEVRYREAYCLTVLISFLMAEDIYTSGT
jgi:aminomethyltransferase